MIATLFCPKCVPTASTNFEIGDELLDREKLRPSVERFVGAALVPVDDRRK